MYHDYKKGTEVRYAKFETFPIWSIPLKHPVNIAYEAATADLRDVNMIDSFHLEAYGEMAVNYNRDLEVFPVVKRIIEKITGSESVYKSPTDMGVNRAGFAIYDDEAVKDAACQEIIRRYLAALCDYKKGRISEESVERSKLLMDELDLKVEDRKVVRPAQEYAEQKRNDDEKYENVVVMSIELPDGRIVTGRSSHRMVASAAAILNAIKAMAGIQDNIPLISPSIIENIQKVKKEILQHEKASLHTEEILSALTISSATNPTAEVALGQLSNLRGCQAHCTAILSEQDEQTIKAMGIDVSCDPEYISNNLYFG
jgi:uncharacterized protein (UPF0371 family)